MGLSTSTFELLNSVQMTMVKNLEDAAEKAVTKMEHSSSGNAFYFAVWDTIEDFLPELLNWFAKIFRKILKLSSEGSSIETKAISFFLFQFTALLQGILLALHFL